MCSIVHYVSTEVSFVALVLALVRDVVPRVAVVGPVDEPGVALVGGGVAAALFFVALAKRLAERHERCAPPNDVREAPVRAPHGRPARRATRLVHAAQSRGGAQSSVARARASQVLEVEQRVRALGVSVELERGILRIRGEEQVRDERLRLTRKARERLQVRAAVVARSAVIVARRRREHRCSGKTRRAPSPPRAPTHWVKKGGAFIRCSFLDSRLDLRETLGRSPADLPLGTEIAQHSPLGSARRQGAREATAAVPEATSSDGIARGGLRAAPRRPRRARAAVRRSLVNGTFLRRGATPRLPPRR